MTLAALVFLAGGIAAAEEEPRPVPLDEAGALGPPAQHDAFADCECVGLAWHDPEARVLDIPAASVHELQHVVTDGGPHRFVLVTDDDLQLELEQAPCAFIAAMAERYATLLERPVRVVDEAGLDTDRTCADPMARAREWGEEQARRAEWVEVDDITSGLLARIETRGRGPDGEEAARSTRREWAALRPRLGHCFSREQAPPPRSQARVSLVADVDGTVRDLRLHRSTRSERVDACLLAVLGAASLQEPPAGPARVRLDVSFGDE